MCGLVFRNPLKYRNHRQTYHPAEYTIEKENCKPCQIGFETAEQCKEHVWDQVRTVACFLK